MTQLSDSDGRTAALAKLGSATTLASVVGTAIGGYLSARFGRRAPCFLAAGLFAADFVLVQTHLPDSLPLPSASSSASAEPAATPTVTTAADSTAASPPTPTPSPKPVPSPKVSPKASLRLDGFRAAFSGLGGRLLALRLMYGLLVRSAYVLHAMYELERWQVQLLQPLMEFSRGGRFNCYSHLWSSVSADLLTC